MTERRTLVDIFWIILLAVWSLTILFPLVWLFYALLGLIENFTAVFGRFLSMEMDQL